ncbi:MAG: 50S ribosomal protein L25 [Acidimicrobiales bacterium]
MPEISLVAETGRTVGSAPARRLRAGARIPAVVYGHGQDPIAVDVDARALRSALTTEAGLNALLNIQVGSDSHLALAREIQRHPVKGTVMHVDFLIVRRDEVISAEVSLNVVGEALQVHRSNGVVDQQLFNLTIRAVPSAIPASIEVDITDLEVGAAIRVSDIVLPPGVETEVDPASVIVLGEGSRTEAEAEAADAATAEAAAEAGVETAEPEGDGSAGSGDTPDS